MTHSSKGLRCKGMESTPEEKSLALLPYVILIRTMVTQRPMSEGSCFPSFSEMRSFEFWLEALRIQPCTQACFFGMAPEGANCPPDFHVKYSALADNSRPVQWARRCWAAWTMLVRDSEWLRQRSSFPSGLSNSKAGRNREKEKAKTQICLKLNWPTEITTKNTEHSLPGIAALIRTNKKNIKGIRNLF